MNDRTKAMAWVFAAAWIVLACISAAFTTALMGDR